MLTASPTCSATSLGLLWSSRHSRGRKTIHQARDVWYIGHMKRFISTVLVTSMLASSGLAWADPAPVITPLQKSQPAPYTGVLLSPEAIAKIVAAKDESEKALQLAVQHQSQLDAAELQFKTDQLTTTCVADKKILQAQVDDGKRQIKILDDKLKSQTSGPSAPVWIGLGAVGGVVVTVLTVFAVSRATK